MPQGNGIRRSKDLRARFRKFLNLTNERKKMSTTTLRKRISLVAITALTAGVLTVVASPVASANHPAAGVGNGDAAALGTPNGSLFVATASNTTSSAAVATAAAGTSGLSKGLLSKDTSSGTAQTATVLAGGALSLYAPVTTASAFTATGGTFSLTRSTNAGVTALYSSNNSTTVYPILLVAATAVATVWTAPTTPGTYSINLLTGFYLASNGTSRSAPDLDNLPPTLSGRITVSVVASSAGGSYSAAYSACQTSPAGASTTAGTTNLGIDTTAIFADGEAVYINYDLNDGYNANLSSGNIVVTATNGAFVNVGQGGTLAAGTSSTDVDAADGTGDSVRIDQPTAGAPLTTTVTIAYNGTTVCTKTVTIRGKATKLTVENVGTQKTNNTSTTTTPQWMYQKIGVYAAGGSLFTVVATDSAGNVVDTPTAYGTYSVDATTVNTIVQTATVNTRSSTSTASSVLRYNLGSWTCGNDAGSANIKIKLTITATGDVITSDPFAARCAGDAVTYSASLDKASYNQGELATVTVKFLDSKGNPTHTVFPVGANTWSLPYMTGIDVALAATNPASSTAVTSKNDGTSSYLLTVGTTSGLSAGTYTGVIEFSSPVLGTKQTPTYKLSTGGDATTNADVLKSIVALIASINKQIQALQKLILKR